MGGDAPIPESVAAVTPDWLSRVLSMRYPGAEAGAVEIVDSHSGTTGRARVRAIWKRECGAPRAIFVKLAPTDPIQRQMVESTGMGRREARFYAELADEVPVRVPRPLWAGYSEDGARYVMLVEDLEEAGCTFPSSKHDDGGKHAVAMMDTLASLHAHYWASGRFAEDLSWIEPPMRHDVGPLLVGEALKQFGAGMPRAFHELAELYLEHTEALCDLLDEGPQTLIHGDSHLGNTFVDRDRVGLLDWACTCRAPGLRDVSYYLCASTPTGLRRRSQHALLRRYLFALAEAGVSGPGFEEAWRQVRRFAVCAWIAATVTAAAGSRMQSVEVGMRAMRRATAAIVDLETPALLRAELGLGPRATSGTA